MVIWEIILRVSNLGHQVIGIESSQIACEQFFTENNIKFTKQEVNGDLVLFAVIAVIVFEFLTIWLMKYYLLRATIKRLKFTMVTSLNWPSKIIQKKKILCILSFVCILNFVSFQRIWGLIWLCMGPRKFGSIASRH